MPRYSLNQHRAQAFYASRAIEREAARLAAERSIPYDLAISAVFADPVLLAACHAEAPRMTTLSPKWVDPNNEPK